MKVLRAISRMTVVGVIILLLVVAGAGYYFLTQQGTTPVSFAGTINVVAATGYNDAAVNKIASDFMAQHPNTTVNVLTVPYGNLVTKYLSVFQANLTSYDVLTLGSVGFLGSLYPYLLDVTPYLKDTNYFGSTAYNYSDLLTSLLPLYAYKGAQLGMPESSSAMVFYYRPSFFNNSTNQQLFQQQYGYALSVPTTLSQLTDVAQFVQKNQLAKYGIEIMSGPDSDDAIQSYMALVAGPRNNASSTLGSVTAPYGVLMDSKGNIIINSTMGEQTISSFLKLMQVAEAPTTASFSTTPGYFANGDAPMMVYWAPPVYYLNNASRSSVAGDFMVAPKMPGGYSILGGTGLGVAANSQNKQLAVEFVTFATGQAEGGYWNALNNLVPFRYSAFAASIAAHPDLAAMLNNVASTMANSLQGSANVPLWPQISTAFRTTLPLIYQNKTSLSDGVNTMMQEIASSAP